MSKRLAVLLVSSALIAGWFPSVAQAATFTVNSTADPGTGGCNAAECTLREAIQGANSNPNNSDTINFNIPGPGPHTITPLTPLPDVSRNVTIDATTEAGYAGTPVVELNGTLATLAGPFANGLRLAGSGGNGNSTVKGLAINRFGGNGILVTSSANTVQANHIGTDTTGTVRLGNGNGIEVTAASNTIGGTTAAARNVISGNNGEGLRVQGASNVVQGNYIGTDATGTLPLGNGAGARGVLVISGTAATNTIGGLTAGARNVISGNGTGIWVVSAGAGNTIQGNHIGTNAAGTAAIGNPDDGITIQATTNTVVGGTTAGARNVISGNGDGVSIQGSAATGNLVQGNYIGTDATGTNPLGNLQQGVWFHSSGTPGGPPSGNTIGGTAAGAGNTIAFNGGTGVRVETGASNVILSNSIFSNGSLGIDLIPFGPTPNDEDDGDTGANELQNFPVITEATTDGSSTTVEGMLNSRPNTTYRIEIFSSPACDPSGFGEGRTFRTAVNVTTDASGDAPFTANAGAVPEGQVITATATDPNGNTSEFSACREVRPARATPATLTLSPKADTNPVGTSHTVTATVSDAGGGPVSGVLVRFSVTGSVTSSGSCTTDTAGQCGFTYDGPETPGADAISAFADTDGDGTQDVGEPGDTASKAWAAAAPETVVLTPAADTNPVGTQHTVTATVRDAFGNPTPDIVVRFTVTGAVETSGQCTTDAQGQCDFTYDGPEAPGADAITAFADTDEDGTQDAGEPQGAAEKTWVPGPPATLVLTPPADENPVGTQHTVTATVTDAFGNPTPGITVRFTVTGSVDTSGQCTTDAAGQCGFTYMGPELPGADVITAFADTNGDGDQDTGEPQGAAEKTWVLPVSTPLCEVIISDGGRITANNGDKATFGGNAKVSQSGQASGEQTYRDHGPAQPFHLKSIEVLAVTCSTDRKEATIYGRATVDGSGDHLFLIQVRDAGKSGKNDTYRILIANGYDSGVHQLEGGNVSIK
jgi:CSLREA domain-containing protein